MVQQHGELPAAVDARLFSHPSLHCCDVLNKELADVGRRTLSGSLIFVSSRNHISFKQARDSVQTKEKLLLVQ